MHFLRLFSFAAFVALAPATAMAQAASNTEITAYKYAPLPADQPLRLEYDFSSDANAQLLPILEQELRNRGFTVTADGPVRLEFSTDVKRRVYADRPSASDPSSGGVEGNQAIRTPAQSTIFQPVKRATPRDYILQMRALEDKTGRMLWQGSYKATILATDRNTAFRAIAPLLVTYIGKTREEVEGQ